VEKVKTFPIELTLKKFKDDQKRQKTEIAENIQKNRLKELGEYR